MKHHSRRLLPLVILAGSIVPVRAQLFFTGGTNSYLTPSFRGSANTELSRWDNFYAPYGAVNFPDIAAPNGTKQLRSVAGFPTNSVYSPADPLAFWNSANPTLTQTGGAASGAFIIGANGGNIYSFGAATSFEIADATPYAALGTVHFQWQSEGSPMSASSLKLVYNNGTEDVFLSPDNRVFEYKSSSSAFGFAPIVRASAQWDLTGLGIHSYRVVFNSTSSSMSFQEVVLDTADTYAEVTPAARTWNGGAGNANWSTAANWAGNAISSTGSNVTIAGGNSILVDTPRTVGTLNLNAPGNFTVSGGSLLTVNTGFQVNAPGVQTIDAPVYMGAFNVNHVATGATLVFNGALSNNSANSGGGFYKDGDGTLVLAGDNLFTGGVVLDGGTLRIAHAGALNSATPNTVGFVAGTPAGSRVQLNGFSVTVGGLATGTDALGTEPGQPVVENGSATDITLRINSTLAGTFAGILRDGGSGRLTLIKSGAETQTFTGVNTYTGSTSVTEGTLVVASDRSLGALPVTTVPGHLSLDGGGIGATTSFTLSSQRGLTIGPASGTGTGKIDTQTSGATLNYLGVIGNQGAGTGALLKTGPGTLALSGANTYTGGTTVSGGLLQLSADNNLGIAPAGVTPGHLVLNGAGLLATESFTLAAQRGLAVGGTGNGTVSVAAEKTLTYAGTVANNGAVAGGLAKNGQGRLVLGGNNAYTGPTLLNSGTLELDFTTAPSATDILATSSALQLAGGTLKIKGQAFGTSAQTVANTALPLPAHSDIVLESNGGGGTTLALGAITRNATGGTVNFTLPSVGAITFTTTAVASNTTVLNDVLVSAAASNGVAYATVGNADWASLSAGKIIALANYETRPTPMDWGETENIALSANATGVVTAKINTLKLQGGADVAIDNGQILTVATGGVLVTGSGASSIIGGTLRGSGGTTKDLTIFQNNATDAFTIESVVANNGSATGLTKTGPGKLVLTGLNSFTGPLRILGGVLEVGAVANGGASSNLGAGGTGGGSLILDDATLRYTGPAATTNRGFTLGGNGAALDASGTGALAISGNVTLNGTNLPRTLTLTGGNAGNNTLTGIVPNNGAAAVSLLKDGPGTWVLAGANTFTGGVTIQQGTLKLGVETALNAATLNALRFSPTAAAGAKLQLNGFSASVASLTSSTSAVVVENGGAADATLTVTNWSDIEFQGALQDGAGGGKLGLTKSGAGTLLLSGANTYTGPTVVNSGALVVSGSLSGTADLSVGGTGRLQVEGSLNTSLPLTIDDGGTLGGQGTMGPITLLDGGTIAPGSSPGVLHAASMAWNDGGVLDFELGSTPLNSDRLSLSGAFTHSTPGDFVFHFTDLHVTPGTSYELVTFGSTNFAAADFQFVTEGPITGSFTVDSDSVNFVVAVPEPASALLLLASGAFLTLRRRRRA